MDSIGRKGSQSFATYSEEERSNGVMSDTAFDGKWKHLLIFSARGATYKTSCLPFLRVVKKSERGEGAQGS